MHCCHYLRWLAISYHRKLLLRYPGRIVRTLHSQSCATTSELHSAFVWQSEVGPIAIQGNLPLERVIDVAKLVEGPHDHLEVHTCMTLLREDRGFSSRPFDPGSTRIWLALWEPADTGMTIGSNTGIQHWDPRDVVAEEM